MPYTKAFLESVIVARNGIKSKGLEYFLLPCLKVKITKSLLIESSLQCLGDVSF